MDMNNCSLIMKGYNMDIHEANIINALSLATPQEIEAGKQWYLNARIICRKISKQYHVPFIKVCGILSALSVGTSWEQNIKDVKGFLGSEFYKCTTYGANVRKAESILNLDKPKIKDILKVLNGEKITRFFLNVYSSRFQEVTIDRHMISLWHGSFDHNFIPTSKRLKRIRDTFTRIAELHDLRPYQLQAITWLVWKRINNI